jgi:DNA mismatch endonuclease Vsr
VFVDGNFWHGENFERLKKSDNNAYWLQKIQRNLRRDEQVNNILRSEGWKIMRVWESDIKRKSTRDNELNKIREFLTN